MKIDLLEDGTLKISTETPIEIYALEHWCSKNKGTAICERCAKIVFDMNLSCREGERIMNKEEIISLLIDIRILMVTDADTIAGEFGGGKKWDEYCKDTKSLLDRIDIFLKELGVKNLKSPEEIISDDWKQRFS